MVVLFAPLPNYLLAKLKTKLITLIKTTFIPCYTYDTTRDSMFSFKLMPLSKTFDAECHHSECCSGACPVQTRLDFWKNIFFFT
jgi:hypothetical protein